MACYHWNKTKLIINVCIQTCASCDEIVGFQNERLKIRITASPVDGKANLHLIKFLSKVFGTPRSNILLLKGKANKNKRLQIFSPKKLPLEIS